MTVLVDAFNGQDDFHGARFFVDMDAHLFSKRKAFSRRLKAVAS